MLYGIRGQPIIYYFDGSTSQMHMVAAWLAQLVERRTAVREVVGLNPRPDQHSGS